MSTGNVRGVDSRKITAFMSAVIGVVAALSCLGRGSDDQSDGDLDRYFLRDVAAAEAAGITVYWLGREFTADGLVFRGPYGAEFGAEVEGGGVDMTYLGQVEGGGNTGLDLIVYSRTAWALAEERIANPKIPGEPRPVRRQAVTVGQRDGELLFLPLATREVNELWLLLDLGGVVVRAVARSGGPVYPGGPDYNPFINNPDLLVALMEDLRPYPE